MIKGAINAANAIESLATSLASHWTDGGYHSAVGTWTTPPVSRQMLSRRAQLLAERIRSIADDKIDSELQDLLEAVPEQSEWLTGTVLPNSTGGNVTPGLAALDVFLSTLERCLPPEGQMDWEAATKAHLVPRELNRRIKSIDASITKIEPDVAGLEAKIRSINEAHSVAVDLPVDMQALASARAEIETLAKDSIASRSRIQQALEAAEASRKEIEFQENEASSLIAKIDAAYSAATSAGLAASFESRARSLNISTRWWVGFLMAALILGGVLGYLRLDHLQGLSNGKDIKPEWVWINLLMSVVAIAAPVWFAWLATRQIGQRFRLAEDYAFKASVARAYEGYRKEAVRIDPKLEARLFASALDRLEEPPLRFLAVEEHSSPYEALLSSPAVQRAIDKVPDLKGAIAEVFKKPVAVPVDSAKLPIVIDEEVAAPSKPGT